MVQNEIKAMEISRVLNINICAKLCWNPSSRCRDTILKTANVNIMVSLQGK